MAIDLKDPALYAAGVPYAEFARLRRDDPVAWNPESDGAGFWSVTRMADIVAVSRDPGLFSSAHEWGGHRIFNENEVGLTGAGESAIGIPFISRDPPIHTRYRKFVMPALSPVRLGDIEARIRARVEALVDAIPLGAPVDILHALSAPLPLLTLAELLGVPADLWPRLYDWTNAFVGEDDPDFRQSPEAMQAVIGEFFGFCTDLFAARRESPGEDIASLLANAHIDGEPVPFGDFVGNLILVLVGGNETTRNSLSHTLMRFAEQPGEWEKVRADPAILKTGVKEMVRHASPVLHMRRTATADTELSGTAIRKGDKVVLWYASGDRDERAFDDPDRFDLSRGNIVHVGFGSGQHVCVGSRLAEMQLRVAFETLATRVTGFAVTAEPKRLRSNFINGLKTLEMELKPGEERGMTDTVWTNEAIISDALGRAADLEIGSHSDGWRLSRWRQFVGSYNLPALPDPTFVVHIAGKPRVKTWERDGWSETSSIPGCATILPAGQPSGWLVDGELDVVTLSIASKDLQAAPARDQFQRMRFAFADPLGAALTRQVLHELYAPQTVERQVYVTALVGALKAHMIQGPHSASAGSFPTSDFSAYRIHHIMNAVLARPEDDHSLEAMAAEAGLTPSHFCRVFKKATGVSPHQYVMKARLDRAQNLLSGSDLTIAQVADALGFASQSHFTRAFRAHAGQTPGAWRATTLQ